MPEDQIEKIKQWAENSGRALELRVTRAFRERTRVVQQSVHYRDGDTDREIDVLAQFETYPRWGPGGDDRPALRLRVYVECKTAKPGTNWVGFRDPNHGRADATQPENDLIHLEASDDSVIARYKDAWRYGPTFEDYPTVSHVHDAHTGNDSTSSRESSYAAIRQVLSASRSGIDDTISSFTQAGATRGIGIMALVVTTVPLFVCELDGQNRVAVAPVDCLGVSHVAVNGGHTRVHVVNESALEAHLNLLAGVLENLAESTTNF